VLQDGRIAIRGLVGSVDGKTIIRGRVEGDVAHAETLGVRLGDDLLESGAKQILEEVYRGQA